MRTKNVNKGNQLQEFIPNLIELTNDSESNKIKNIRRKQKVSQDNQMYKFITNLFEQKN